MWNVSMKKNYWSQTCQPIKKIYPVVRNHQFVPREFTSRFHATPKKLFFRELHIVVETGPEYSPVVKTICGFPC